MGYVGRTSHTSRIVLAFFSALEDECEAIPNVVSDDFLAGYNAAREDMREHLRILSEEDSDLSSE